MSLSDPLPADVIDAVRRCVCTSLAVPEDRVTPTTRIVDDLGADSLDFVDIVFLLEEEMGVAARSTDVLSVDAGSCSGGSTSSAQ